MSEERMVTNPVKRIRKYCLECCREFPSEVEKCPVTGCQLYPFRMGNNPFRAKRELTDEQREEAAANLRKARLAKNSG